MRRTQRAVERLRAALSAVVNAARRPLTNESEDCPHSEESVTRRACVHCYDEDHAAMGRAVTRGKGLLDRLRARPRARREGRKP